MFYLYLNIIHTGNHLFFYISLVTGIILVRVTSGVYCRNSGYEKQMYPRWGTSLWHAPTHTCLLLGQFKCSYQSYTMFLRGRKETHMDWREHVLKLHKPEIRSIQEA